MAETEAACLLRSGSAYPRRLGLLSKSGLEILAGFKPGGASLYYGDAPIYHFDLDGRWQRAFVDGVHYLKGLDATVRAIDRVRDGESLILRRRTLGFVEASDLDASIRSAALDLIAGVDGGGFELIAPPSPAQPIVALDLRDWLEQVAGWDATAWFAHRERYLATYGVWPFLPPDCSNAIVLQATLGHRDGLAFGGGKPQEHYVRSAAEFEAHAKAVSRLLGRRATQSPTVFLGGPDVLLGPVHEVVASLEVVGRTFSRPVHAFLDRFDQPLPDAEGWQKLRVSGLERVTLGVESGDPRIRSTFARTWDNQDLIEVVRAMKASEIGLGLVLLVGACGRSMAATHVDQSIKLVGGLPLGEGDIITLVDGRFLNDSGSEPLDDVETAHQVAALKLGLRKGRVDKGPRVVAYNPNKQGL